MFCTNCGEKVPDGASACPSCGAPLTHRADDVAHAPEAPLSRGDAMGQTDQAAAEHDEDERRLQDKLDEETATAWLYEDSEAPQSDLGASESLSAPQPDAPKETMLLPARQTAAEKPSGRRVVYCAECGTPNEPGSRFCVGCGRPLGQGIPSPAAEGALPPMAQPLYGSGSEEQPSAPKKKSKAPMVATIVAIVLVGVVGIFIGVYAMSNASSNRESLSQQEQQSDGSSSNGEPSGRRQGGTEDASVSSGDVGGTEEASAQASEAEATGAKAYSIIDQAMTWSEAEDYCVQHGGHLASITSQEEWDQVQALIRADGRGIFWIGGRRDSSGNFTWTDGSTFSFSSWADGEPNNDGGPEDYLVVYDVKGNLAWYDVPNDISSYYKEEKMAFVMETFS